MKNSGGGGVGSLVFSSVSAKEESDSTDGETSFSPNRGSGLLRAVPEVYRDGKSREGKYEVLDALVGDKDIVGIAKKSSVKERVGCAMGCWASSGDGERVENGEAKKAFVFEFVGEDVTDVEEVMSENVDDSDEVLEPDERDRSAPIPGCRNNNNTSLPESGKQTRFDVTCSFTSFLPFTM